MSFTFIKDDPSVFHSTSIQWDENPIDSLDTINSNFLNLDFELCNIELSAINFWSPLYTQVSESSGKWDSMFTTVAEHSGGWQSMYTSVFETSAGWLTPISIIYPSVPLDFNPTVIHQWVVNTFPVRRDNCTNYLNGQILNVYVIMDSIRFSKGVVRCNSKNPNGCPNTTRCRSVTVKTNDRVPRSVRVLEFKVDNFDWKISRSRY
jgi:hypothetical protein